MKITTTLLLTFLQVALRECFRYEPPEGLSSRAAEEKWGVHKAKIDNFRAMSGTYDQRYISYEIMATGDNPPLIIYVGGEWEIKTGQITSSQLLTIAEENNGAIFYLEHRFYGKSMPKKNYRIEYLKYHNSQQAMADLLAFIKEIRKSNPKYTNSKVVLFGCSYSATLSTWFKHDYPSEVQAGYATSGPMLPKANMKEFLERASLVMGLVDNDCSKIVKNGINELQELWKEDDGPKKVRKMLGFCEPNDKNYVLNKQVIFQNMAAYWGNMIQTNLPGYQNECKKLKNTTGDTPGEKLAAYRKESDDYCVNMDYATTVSQYSDPSDMYGSLRPFFYQQCTNFGWFVTTDSNNQNFGNVVSIDFYYQLCGDAFNKTVNEASILAAIQVTKERYGGQSPTINNTVFAYGGLDPWQPMGLNYPTPGTNSKVFYIGSGGHCHDMFQILSTDGDDMVAAKGNITLQIKEFLNMN